MSIEPSTLRATCVAAALALGVSFCCAQARADEPLEALPPPVVHTPTLTLREDNVYIPEPTHVWSQCGADSLTPHFGELREIGAPGHRGEALVTNTFGPTGSLLDMAVRAENVIGDLSPDFIPRTCLVLGGTLHVLGDPGAFGTVGARLGIVTRTDGGLSSLRLDLEALAPAVPSDPGAALADASRHSAALAPNLDDVYALSALTFAVGGRARTVATLIALDAVSVWLDIDLAGRLGRVRTDYGDREGLSGVASLGLHFCWWPGSIGLCVAGSTAVQLSTFYTADIRVPLQAAFPVTALIPLNAGLTLRIDGEFDFATLALLPAPTPFVVYARALVGLVWANGI